MNKESISKTYLNYINGQWVASHRNETSSSVNPARVDDVVGHVQLSTAEDVADAVRAAKDAQKAWSRMAYPSRGQFLYAVANRVEARADEIAQTMTREMGKPLSEAKGETLRGVAILRYYAAEGLHKIGDVIPSFDASSLMFTTRSPLGVVGIITPWNFPVAIPMWKIAPALIYGNTVVFKPAENSVVTAALLVECFEEAGLPAGVLNYVTGRGSVVGQAIVEHRDVAGISFTGSDNVGINVGMTALARGAKYQLEMGGKNPVIVAADADLDLAVEATVSGGLRSTGQKCTATSRVLVDRKVYAAFREKLLSKVKSIRVGDGLQPETWMGPCVNDRQMETVLSYVQIGLEEGATLAFGGARATEGDLSSGYFVEPTVFENVTSGMRIAQEEIFGPVLALIPFENLTEALEIANDSRFGLSASIFTKNIGHMMSFIQDMDAGLVRINAESAGVELQAPFGGMKHSGSHSREQGQSAIEFFTEIKTVFIKDGGIYG